MKNLFFTKTSTATPTDEGKYVNYAKTEDKVNYFDTVPKVEPEFPEITKIPALSDIPEDIMTIARNNHGTLELVAPSKYIFDPDKPILGICSRRGGDAYIIGIPPVNTPSYKWDTDPEKIASLPAVESDNYGIPRLDFDSKGNTDKILAERPTTAEAAIFCRNYEVPGIGKGKWDLPAAGALDNAFIFKSGYMEDNTAWVDALRVLGNEYVKKYGIVIGYPTSTQYDWIDIWFSNHGDTNDIDFGYPKNMNYTVLPFYTLYQSSVTDLSGLLRPYDTMPEGVSIVDVDGRYIPVNIWHTGDHWTGVALNTPGWKGILGVSKTRTNTGSYVPDDFSIETVKYWGDEEKDIPGILNASSLEEAITDFKSKENTDAMLADLNGGNFAAATCRNYEAGVIGKGKWDLPAAGIVQIIFNNIDEINKALEVLGTNYHIVDCYSSTEARAILDGIEYNEHFYWGIPDDEQHSTSLDLRNKDVENYCTPVYQLFAKPAVKPEDIVLPEGISVVDGLGYPMQVSEWDASMGLTGLGVNNGGKLVFIMAVGTGFLPSVQDDMSINSLKYWSNVLKDTDIPSIANTVSAMSAIQDINSKENTDAILTTLASSSNPQETNNAAVVCRNYEAGVIGKGKWDLPSAGILQAIHQKVDEITEALTTMGYQSWSNAISGNLDSNLSLWSSTERYVEDFNTNSELLAAVCLPGRLISGKKDKSDISMVVPVYYTYKI